MNSRGNFLKPKIKTTVLIPARGGSKGLSGKNIRLIDNKPLLAHSILDALEAQQVDRIYVTTNLVPDKFVSIVK